MDGKAPHIAWYPVLPQWPLKIQRTECLPHSVVLITTSGLQGAQPLDNGIMSAEEVGKMNPKPQEKDWLRGLGTRVPVPSSSAIGRLLELFP